MSISNIITNSYQEIMLTTRKEHKGQKLTIIFPTKSEMSSKPLMKGQYTVGLSETERNRGHK